MDDFSQNETIHFQFSECMVNKTCAIFLYSLSHFTLLGLTVDRYIFITTPLHYQVIMTSAKTWSIMGGVLGLSAAVAVLAVSVFQVNINCYSYYMVLIFRGIGVSDLFSNYID